MENKSDIYKEFSSIMDWLSLSKGNNSNQNNNIIIEDNTSNSTIKIEKPNEQEKPVQNSKRRCQICKAKISLVDELVSSCECENKFCSKHRMPESHSCVKLVLKGQNQKEQLAKSLVKLGDKQTLEKI
jgi:hypothetical protein